jgi:hypothetical protein
MVTTFSNIWTDYCSQSTSDCRYSLRDTATGDVYCHCSRDHSLIGQQSAFLSGRRRNGNVDVIPEDDHCQSRQRVTNAIITVGTGKELTWRS